MIIFNDVALNSVAPVMVEDIKISPISMSATARQRPIKWGADFVRMTGGTRTVTITFGLLTEDISERADQVREITRWARSAAPGKLMLPGHDGVYLEVVCTGLPEPSARQWWESRLRIVFQTFDNPYWTGIEEHDGACGSAIMVMGSAPPLMRVRAAFDQTVTNRTYGIGTETMTFSSLPAGTLTIDFNKQTADVGGTSVMSAFSFGSVFPEPRTGAQTVTGIGRVKWRERWE